MIQHRFAKRMVAAVGVAALGIAVIITGCTTQGTSDDGGSGPDSGDTPDVVATTTVWGDVVAQLTGAEGVEVLMPVGADPHEFQASSQQAAAVVGADLTVANGLGLEEGMHDLLASADRDGANVLEVGPLIDPLPFGDAEVCDPGVEDGGGAAGNAEDGDGHDHGSCDPHIWMDPRRVADAAAIIASELADLDPTIDWAAKADAYQVELDALDAEIDDILSVVPDEHRVLVTSHRSFGYFADRYGFETIGVIVPGGATLAEPSSEELSDLVAAMRDAGVRVIFTETILPATLAEALADEFGGDVEVVELYTGSLGEPGSGADTLVGMLRTNAQRIAAALS